MNGYIIYVTLELAKAKGLIEQDLEYDLAWEKATALHKEYEEATEYNMQEKSEYDCISDFLNDYKLNTENDGIN